MLQRHIIKRLGERKRTSIFGQTLRRAGCACGFGHDGGVAEGELELDGRMRLSSLLTQRKDFAGLSR